MTLGIKVGLQKTSIADLGTTKASMCEVWFDINRADQYMDLFSYVADKDIETGLHYWGALEDGTLTNIAYPDNTLITASMDLMKKCVDCAAKHGFVYVNIHPGARAKAAIDFRNETFARLSEPVAYETSESIFLENILYLDTYAKHLGVLLTVETVPARVNETYSTKSREKDVNDIYELPLTALIKAADYGIAIANDFGHTAAQFVSDDRNAVSMAVRTFTSDMASRTRLIHAGFIVKPYNGTDFHDTFENPVFETTDAVPNKNELSELLKLFAGRSDVRMLAEPNGDHVGNYNYLKNLLTTIDIPFV